jgi:uncharacterized membrane protein YccF (DUF307 family)
MTTTVTKKNNPGCLQQILWFAFIGWWLGQLWIAVAWFLMATIIGIPFAVIMINKLPKVIALREPDEQVQVRRRQDGSLEKHEVEKPQVNIILRALYFVLIGWWFSALWMEAAYWFCMSVIGLPIGFWMFDATPAVLSLKR